MFRKNWWWKGALLIGAGTMLQLSGGCLSAVLQRAIVAISFD